MTGHDPLCPDLDWDVPAGIVCADCQRIERIRADERENVLAAVRSLPAVLVDVTPFSDQAAPHKIDLCVRVADVREVLGGTL